MVKNAPLGQARIIPYVERTSNAPASTIPVFASVVELSATLKTSFANPDFKILNQFRPECVTDEEVPEYNIWLVAIVQPSSRAPSPYVESLGRVVPQFAVFIKICRRFRLYCFVLDTVKVEEIHGAVEFHEASDMVLIRVS